MSNSNYIEYGTERICFHLSFDDRKNIEIAVQPNCRIEVKSPEDIPLETIKKRITKRAPWILKKIREFEKFHPLQPPRKYVSGETHLYLGRKYRLKIEEGSDKSIKFSRGRYWIKITELDKPEHVKRLLYSWYKKRAKEVFEERHKLLLKRLVQMDIPEHSLKIQKMHKRWGSCTGDTIILNLELIKAEKLEIDYVIAHELCHLFERNHDKNFYKLLSIVFPEWPSVKERLNYKGIYVD